MDAINAAHASLRNELAAAAAANHMASTDYLRAIDEHLSAGEIVLEGEDSGSDEAAPATTATTGQSAATATATATAAAAAVAPKRNLLRPPPPGPDGEQGGPRWALPMAPDEHTIDLNAGDVVWLTGATILQVDVSWEVTPGGGPVRAMVLMVNDQGMLQDTVKATNVPSTLGGGCVTKVGASGSDGSSGSNREHFIVNVEAVPAEVCHLFWVVASQASDGVGASEARLGRSNVLVGSAVEDPPFPIAQTTAGPPHDGGDQPSPVGALIVAEMGFHAEAERWRFDAIGQASNANTVSTILLEIRSLLDGAAGGKKNSKCVIS